MVLGDGTLVCLNSESELRYPVRFDGEERQVFLRGEGYFEVTKDPDHPFVVEVENARIEVLGTTFNVCSYEEEERVVTTLVEGWCVCRRKSKCGIDSERARYFR